MINTGLLVFRALKAVPESEVKGHGLSLHFLLEEGPQLGIYHARVIFTPRGAGSHSFSMGGGMEQRSASLSGRREYQIVVEAGSTLWC